MYDYILVLDFGSQYNMLICRRLRELGVFSELKPYNISIAEIKKIKNLKGIVLSGGPNSVYSDDSFDIDPEIFNLGVPVLGICYGLQIMCHKLGGNIIPSTEREYGKALLDFSNKGLLFNDIDDKPTVWMSHGDKVESIPEGFSATSSTPTCEFASIENTDKKLYGVQFHPEVRNTVDGNQILSNFVYKICEARDNWKMENYVSMVIDDVRKTVGDKRVLLGLSGGVDSSVVAALLHKAIGDQLTCMFIDNGLLRKNEGDEVVKTFKETFDMDIVRIDAKDIFLNDLKGLTDPEAKRKSIGAQFVYTFDRECKKIGNFDFLAQGTLYTDVIESGTETAQTIKSHHNVGGLPKDIKFKLIEPLRVLFKDEVRELGLVLGLPHNVVWRQPFPGPGLGIRVLGEVTEEKIKIVQDTDYILREEIKKNNLEGAIWQYFTVLPNIQSVGVMGDQRTYSHAIVIRAITSVDGMTGDWARIPYDVLDTISRRIVNECQDVNRVVYDCTSKPPATIEWE